MHTGKSVALALCFMLCAGTGWSEDDFNGRADRQTDNAGYYHVLTTGPAAGGAASVFDGSTPDNAFRFITDDPDWSLPIQLWQNRPWFAESKTLAMTMWLDDARVYENQTLEAGQTGSFYTAANDAGGNPSVFVPGLTSFYSMSNNYDMIYAGYFKITQPITFNKIAGYFAPVSDFSPHSLRIGYRMNIWSAVPSPDNPAVLVPKEASFTGDIFSSEDIHGHFDPSDTGLDRMWTQLKGGSENIWRLTYTLEEPFTLQPGEYYFSHDAVIHEPLIPFILAPGAGMAFALAGGSGGPGGGGFFPPIIPPRHDDPPIDPPSVVPEPGTLTLIVIGGVGLVGVGYWRKRRNGNSEPRV